MSRAHIIHESDDGIIHMLGGEMDYLSPNGFEAIDCLLKDKTLQFGNSNTSSLRLFGPKMLLTFKIHCTFMVPELKKT